MAGRAVTPELGREIVAAGAEGRRLSPGARAEQLRRRQHQVRAVDHRGEVARRLRQERHPRDPRPDQAGRPAAAAGPLPDGHRQRRAGPPRLSQHQRQPDHHRDGGERRPHDRLHHRRRLGGRAGGRAGDQGRVEQPRLPAPRRRHRRQRRHHRRRRRDDRRGRRAHSRAGRRSRRRASRAARRRSATRNSRSTTRPTSRSGRPACRSDARGRTLKSQTKE